MWENIYTNGKVQYSFPFYSAHIWLGKQMCFTVIVITGCCFGTEAEFRCNCRGKKIRWLDRLSTSMTFCFHRNLDDSNTIEWSVKRNTAQRYGRHRPHVCQDLIWFSYYTYTFNIVYLTNSLWNTHICHLPICLEYGHLKTELIKILKNTFWMKMNRVLFIDKVSVGVLI